MKAFETVTMILSMLTAIAIPIFASAAIMFFLSKRMKKGKAFRRMLVISILVWGMFFFVFLDKGGRAGGLGGVVLFVGAIPLFTIGALLGDAYFRRQSSDR